MITLKEILVFTFAAVLGAAVYLICDAIKVPPIIAVFACFGIGCALGAIFFQRT